ncbi:endonuclease domain-containing protein [Micromonospora orduensis]|uniref:endonuclease domain-containing protein n=1 Tax=Micromonospora orduensis TaxID=1420891 RepID=UPI0036417040
MPPRPHRPSALAWQVFRGSDVIRQGLVTRHQLRGSSWIRLRHDVYADARLDRDHALACRAAALRLPPEAVIAGPSSAYLHGIEHAAGFDDDVHVLVPRACRVDSQRRLRVHLLGAADPPPTGASPAATPALPGASPATTPALPGASPAAAPPLLPPMADVGGAIAPRRTDPTSAAWETAVWLDPLRAVPIIDSLLACGLTTQAALTTVGTANADRPGGRRATWVFGLADPGAQSPPESQLRVRLVLGGLPRPVTQHPIRVAGGLVLHPDLAWPEFRVAVEYDGRWHADPEQLHRDRRRLNLLVGAGWLILHVTGRRLYNDFPAVLGEVRSALLSRGWRR